jgi:hypothetical protein
MCIFLTSALVAAECLVSRPGRFKPEEIITGTQWTRPWVGLTDSLDDTEKGIFLTLPEIELRPLGQPARTQSTSLSRLSAYLKYCSIRYNIQRHRAIYPLWSSDQSFWLQTQRSGLDSRGYQIFWEVVGPERCPLSLASTTEELFGRKSKGSGLGNQEYGRKDPCADHVAPTIRKSWHYLPWQTAVARSV